MSKQALPDKVTYQNKEYQIKFRYERPKDQTGKTASKRGKTIAYLEDYNPETIERKIVLSAEASCFHLDNFQKKRGRMIAAGRLLKSLAHQ